MNALYCPDPAAVTITADNAVRCLNEVTGKSVLIQPLYTDRDRARLTAQMKAVSAMTAAAQPERIEA